MLTFPRLPIEEQAAFERYVRRTSDEKAAPFSLAATRNASAMAMSGAITRAKRALTDLQKRQGDPLNAPTDEEVRNTAMHLQDDVAERFAPYAMRLFAGIDRSQMLFAVAQSLVVEYGKEVTYTITTADGKKAPVTMPIDSAFVSKLFTGEPGTRLENVFLWVVGLSEQVPAKTADLEAGMSIDEIAKKTVGDAENSEREQN